MNYIKLGKTQIDVSKVALGTFAIGGKWWGGTNVKDSAKTIEASLEYGINFIDTAAEYGKGLAEEIVGTAIKGKRDKVVIASKCGLRWDAKIGTYFFSYDSGEPVYRCLSKKSIEYEINNSLKRLKTDYIDLYQTHWQDSTTQIEETMDTLMDLRTRGKIRAIGVSNIDLCQLKKYSKYGQLDTDQEEYNMLNRTVEKELLPWCKNNKVTLLTYSSVVKGLLTGKLSPERKFIGDDNRLDDPQYSPENIKRINILLDIYVKPIAEKYNASIANVTVAWLIKEANVIALVGARSRKQAVENVKAGEIILDKTDLELLNNFLKEVSMKNKR